jgi:hypothetical protein
MLGNESENPRIKTVQEQGQRHPGFVHLIAVINWFRCRNLS